MYLCPMEQKISDTSFWKDCPILGCRNKVCLSLDSDKCFKHTKGNRYWKLFRIWYRNTF